MSYDGERGRGKVFFLSSSVNFSGVYDFSFFFSIFRQRKRTRLFLFFILFFFSSAFRASASFLGHSPKLNGASLLRPSSMLSAFAFLCFVQPTLLFFHRFASKGGFCPKETGGGKIFIVPLLRDPVRRHEEKDSGLQCFPTVQRNSFRLQENRQKVRGTFGVRKSRKYTVPDNAHIRYVLAIFPSYFSLFGVRNGKITDCPRWHKKY